MICLRPEGQNVESCHTSYSNRVTKKEKILAYIEVF